MADDKQKSDSAESRPVSMTDVVSNDPALAIIPATGLLGASISNSQKPGLASASKGGLLGALTGMGAYAGSNLGQKMTTDPTTGVLAGGGLGGLLSFIVARKLINRILGEKQAIHPTLASLIEAKQKSDVKKYDEKHQILRNLIRQYPDDFYIDSDLGNNIVGITHRSGFRIHALKNALPVKLKSTLPELDVA